MLEALATLADWFFYRWSMSEARAICCCAGVITGGGFVVGVVVGFFLP